MSGIGVKDLVCFSFPSSYEHMSFFYAYKCMLLVSCAYVGVSIFGNLQAPTRMKPFTLTHYWMKSRIVKSGSNKMPTKKRLGTSSVVEPNEKRPRRKANSKVEAKCDASALALQETLKGFITQKEVSSEKRKDEREEAPRERGGHEELR